MNQRGLFALPKNGSSQLGRLPGASLHQVEPEGEKNMAPRTFRSAVISVLVLMAGTTIRQYELGEEKFSLTTSSAMSLNSTSADTLMPGLEHPAPM